MPKRLIADEETIYIDVTEQITKVTEVTKVVQVADMTVVPGSTEKCSFFLKFRTKFQEIGDVLGVDCIFFTEKINSVLFFQRIVSRSLFGRL